MTIPTLVTLAEAYRHLRRTPSPDGSPSEVDQDLQGKIDAATAIICWYISDRQPPDPDLITTIEGWTPTTAPPEIKAATLEFSQYLDRFRGDDSENVTGNRSAGFLPSDIRTLLVMWRDPVVA